MEEDQDERGRRRPGKAERQPPRRDPHQDHAEQAGSEDAGREERIAGKEHRQEAGRSGNHLRPRVQPRQGVVPSRKDVRKQSSWPVPQFLTLTALSRNSSRKK
jgi:hypothetical protein